LLTPVNKPSQKYNPDLQRASLENRDRRAQEFEDYVSKLKEWSKSDKSSTLWPTKVEWEIEADVFGTVWFAMKEEEARRKETPQLQTARQKEEESSQREDMRRELQGGR
jgi:hypothetical protein